MFGLRSDLDSHPPWIILSLDPIHRSTMIPPDKPSEMKITPVGEDALESDMGVSKVKARDVDRAAAFLAHSHYHDPFTPVQRKRLRRKLDRWIIPMLLFTATLVRSSFAKMATLSV